MDINTELSKLNNNQRQELEKWFAEQIYKLKKVNNNELLNYVPYVTRKQVVWVDFGVNIGQSFSSSYCAIFETKCRYCTRCSFNQQAQ